VSASLGRSPSAARPVRRKIAGEDWVAIVAVGALAVYLFVTVALPLWALLSKSFQNKDGAFVGLTNFVQYFQNPTLSQSIFNSVWVALATTAIVVPLAFVYAYGLTRSCMPLKGLFRSCRQSRSSISSAIRASPRASWAASRFTARSASSWPRSSTVFPMR
jgi:iron(III) transport system permease protein